MKIIRSYTASGTPFVIVQAADEADAEIFAQDNAEKFDCYFKGLEAGTAEETTEGNFKVPFS